MRSINQSAWFISSMDSEYSCLPSFVTPQWRRMRACRKYWLMAVSSLVSWVFRCSTTLGSDFIEALRAAARPLRWRQRPQASRCRQRILGVAALAHHLADHPEDHPGAGAALGLAGAGGIDLARLAGALFHRLFQLAFGQRVAEADDHRAAPLPPARALHDLQRWPGMAVGAVGIHRLAAEAAHGGERRVQRRVGDRGVFHVAEGEHLLRLVGDEEFEEAGGLGPVWRGLH